MDLPTIETRFPALADLTAGRPLSPDEAATTFVVAVTAAAPEALPAMLRCAGSLPDEMACLLRVRAEGDRRRAVVTLGSAAAALSERHPDAGLRLHAVEEAPFDVPHSMFEPASQDAVAGLPGYGSLDVQRRIATGLSAALELGVTLRPPRTVHRADGLTWTAVEGRSRLVQLHGAIVFDDAGLVRCEPSELAQPGGDAAGPWSWLVVSSPRARLLRELRIPPRAVPLIADALRIPPRTW